MNDMAGRPDLLTIGRFSEMTRLSIKALRIYAEMGLLRPAATSERSGYRYYNESQAERAEAIRTLRSIDMPLEEIRRTLDGTPEAAAGALAVHQQRLASDAIRLERMLSIASELSDGRKPLIPYEVTVKEIGNLSVASIRMHVSVTTVERQVQLGFGELMDVLDRQRVDAVAPPLIVFHDVIDDQTDGEIELCVPFAGPVDAEGRMSARTLEGGTVVSTVHRGRYMELAPAYHALSRWMQARSYRADGSPREIYLNNPKDVPETDLLTEVQWPIRAMA